MKPARRLRPHDDKGRRAKAPVLRSKPPHNMLVCDNVMTSMRNVGLIVLMTAALSAQAEADVVYLRSGKTYEGQVLRKGRKVRIRSAYGVVEVDAAEVIHIERSEPSSKPAAKTADLPSPAAGTKRLTIRSATQPEPIIFTLMRNLKGAQAGGETHVLRREIERWRIMAHDRKRKVGLEWLGPEDFSRRRHVFLTHLEEAEDLYRLARRLSERTPRGRAERNRYEARAATRLQQAAKAWPDPLVRSFLMGIAFYQAGEFRQAEAMFRRCRRSAPRVAAFCQGHGMALLAVRRELDAVVAFSEALRLRPESREALDALRDAMRKVPGASAKRPEYLAAAELVREYEDSGRNYRRRGTTWLMPGKAWYVYGSTLPRPPYDRLVFKQAVGVPVADGALLVDESVARGALEVFVRIDAASVVPGKVSRSGGYRGGKEPDGPLAVVRVFDVAFSPLKAEADHEFRLDQSATIYALDIYEEMSSEVQPIASRIVSVEDGGVLKLSGSIFAGQGAAPVVVGDGRLAGFLAGKTDVKADGGGKELFIPVSRLGSALKRANKKSGGIGAYGLYGRRAKRTIKRRRVEGDHFIVYGTFAEDLKK